MLNLKKNLYRLQTYQLFLLMLVMQLKENSFSNSHTPITTGSGTLAMTSGAAAAQKLQDDQIIATLNTNNWALKGDAFAFGFAGQWNGDIEHPIITNVAAQGLPLSASESKATIFQGTNNWPDGIKQEVYSAFFTQPWASNPGINNPVYCVQAPVGADPANQLLANKEIGKPGWVPSGTSLSPRFIQCQDLDLEAAGTRGLSHKLFIHIGYTWQCCECWTPYLGLGAMAEFGQHDFRCGSIRLQAKTCCAMHMHGCQNCLASIQDNDNGCATVSKNNSCCSICAVSQWGAWIKGGVSFN